MITTIDVETSWQKTETGGYDPSPFHPDNILVSVGINDEYYFTDLIGLDVYIGNIKIGKITDVNNHGAGDYCEVKKKTGLFLFPFLKDHVKEVNIELNKIILCKNYYSNEI